MNTSVMRESEATAVLDAASERIRPALRDTVAALPGAMRLVSGYHFGWCGPDGGPVATPTSMGKSLRPALVFLASAAVSGTTPVVMADPATVRAAVAVELVHNFSLIHDDVIDRDVVRRHRQTVWKVFGVPVAILAGDALLALAAQVLARTEPPVATNAVAVLHESVQQLIEGQAADLAFETRDDVGLAECVEMASRKTGALTACACELGALLGEGDPDQVRCLRVFGTHLGLAFQLTDDLLGIWGEGAVTGKPDQADLWARKKSLPVVAALTSGTAAAAELAELYRKPERWGGAEVLRALTLIELAGGRAWARDEAARHVGSAVSCLEQAHLEPATAANLAALARLAAIRDH
ncbi:polyprenyl synthetase family protein [Amycolatopsis azurea]|uniref:Dimethylallyltranstransferase n=1 Tax=Amycolatopsis azurea DSM 43854 TaxID=1238180 RepID=M2PPM0_9PSEU|nr:polyprenyl synthetase family protein [Amycolatopsis azurea]EMD26503.1 Octaprenyl-diphosphate synthase [Amycolatopsis azurea DSM 43854]OOC05637.1 dimethylallyltranstransferase [Amycolatopsis azurea DSM 43854]